MPIESTNDPSVAMSLIVCQPGWVWYVAIRRGMPERPRACIGKNVMLKPTNRIQKLQNASVRLSMRPVIFGYQ